jgi:peptidoglycan hydrolase-like protein with peptidoglycan-binding domain
MSAPHHRSVPARSHRYRSRPARWAHRVVRAVEVTLVVGVVIAAVGVFHLVTSAAPSNALAAGSQSHRRVTPTHVLDVVAVTPSNHQTGVAPTAAVVVRLSRALARSSPMPILSPPEPGHWRQVRPGTLRFEPSAPALPLTTETLTLPGGPHGMRAADGRRLAHSVTVSWQVENGSVLRLQQLLARLGYLPLTWSRTGPAPTGVDAAITELYHPPTGTFSWRWSDIPPTLKAAWEPGVFNRMTNGAMVAFERRDGLPAYDSIRPQLWPDLLSKVADGATNPEGYTYALVSQARPESLTLWHDGRDVYTSVANTGLPGAATPVGTFFIYLRYTSHTMQGVDPITGTTYTDPGVPWINYFDGSVAIHGFVRASYGFPQSLGCVELPPANAAVAWKWLHYGTLVTVLPEPA